MCDYHGYLTAVLWYASTTLNSNTKLLSFNQINRALTISKLLIKSFLLLLINPLLLLIVNLLLLLSIKPSLLLLIEPLLLPLIKPLLLLADKAVAATTEGVASTAKKADTITTVH